MTDAGTPRNASPGSRDVVSGRVSDVSGGQVAIGDRVVQIDAQGGAQVVINEGVEVRITRRDPPILRPAPAFPEFIGRIAEIDTIRTSLQSGRSVEVIGPSGIGKTALLRVVSNADRPHTSPDGVVAVPAQLGVPETLNYLFDACYEGTRRMVPRREELTSALADLRLLVVLDDPLLDRESLDQLRLALPASLFLMSAHEQRMYRGVDGFALPGMSDEEGVSLIEVYVGRPLTDRERAVGIRVSEVLRGTPLELVRFASLVRADADGGLVSVARGFGVDAQPADVLVAVQRSTTAAEDEVLSALAAFGAPVGASLVAALSGRRDAGELLTRLADRGLVNGDDLQGWRRREQRVVTPEERRRAAEVLTSWIHGRSVPEEVAAEIPAITAVLEAAQRDRRWDDAVALAGAAERPLALASRWAAWEATLHAGLRAAKSAADAPSERFFAHQLEVVRTAMAPPPVQPPPQPPAQPPPQPPAQPPPRPPKQPPPRPPKKAPSEFGGPDPTPGSAGTSAADAPEQHARPRWGRVAAVAIVAIGVMVVAVVVAQSLWSSDDDALAPPPPGVASAEFSFGEVLVGRHRTQAQSLALTGAEPPIAIPPADGPYAFRLAAGCASEPDACEVEVTFRPTDAGETSTRVEVSDASGKQVAVVSAEGTGVRVTQTGVSNLVAFTFASESEVLRPGVEEPRTVRVHNQPGDGVEASDGSVLSVVVAGPAVLQNPPRSCSSVSRVELRCGVGPLDVDAKQDFDVTIVTQPGATGGVVLTTTMFTADGAKGRSQFRNFSVDLGHETTAVTCAVPGLEGLSLEQAQERAETAGLELDHSTVEDGKASGLVVSQDPVEGAEVECDSTVVVQISGVA